MIIKKTPEGVFNWKSTSFKPAFFPVLTHLLRLSFVGLSGNLIISEVKGYVKSL